MKKKVKSVSMPEFQASIETMPEDSRIFVDKSLEIANYVFHVMEQKGMKQKDLADKLGKSEAEISKWLAGMHNYTLRSIAKMEAALGEEIVHIPIPHNLIKDCANKYTMVVLRNNPISKNMDFMPVEKVPNKQEEMIA